MPTDSTNKTYRDGKPVHGTFTIAELEEAYGSLEEVIRMIKGAGGYVILGERIIPPVANQRTFADDERQGGPV